MAWYDNIAGPLIEGAATVIGSQYGPQAGGYGATEAGFNAQLQLERDKFVAATAEAQEQNRLRAESIAAQIAAANISAGASKESALIAQQTAIMGQRSKALADSIAQRIEAVKGTPEVTQRYRQALLERMGKLPDRYQVGFQNAANLIAGAGRR